MPRSTKVVVAPRAPLQFPGTPGFHWYVVPRVGYPDPETFDASYRALAELHDELWQRIRYVRGAGGAVLGALEAWLLLRGMRTLHLRVAAACDNAHALARRFEGHPQLSHVLYPGLPRHPGHAVATRQMNGRYGAMMSLRLREGEAAARAFTAKLRVFKRATSLGGVESLIEHRASIEGPNSPCPPDLLRLSVGLEDVDDLYADLDRALRAANA